MFTKILRSVRFTRHHLGPTTKVWATFHSNSFVTWHVSLSTNMNIMVLLLKMWWNRHPGTMNVWQFGLFCIYLFRFLQLYILGIACGYSFLSNSDWKIELFCCQQNMRQKHLRMCFCEDNYLFIFSVVTKITRVLLGEYFLPCCVFICMFQTRLLICVLKVCHRMAVCRSPRAALTDSLCSGMKSM